MQDSFLRFLDPALETSWRGDLASALERNLWIGMVRRRGWGGAVCLKRGSRRAGSALSQARRGVVFGLEGGSGGVNSGG